MSALSIYVGTLRLVREVSVSGTGDEQINLDAAFERMGREMRASHDAGNKLIFIGNGGSAAICSHMAIDYSKNGGIRSTSFNDGAALTCLGNDLGYDQVFAKQIDLHARSGDILIAISSSGRSPNILNAVAAARKCGCSIYTLSGHDPENPLRRMGDINLHLASHEYGFVEVGHLTILHAVLDLEVSSRAGLLTAAS